MKPNTSKNIKHPQVQGMMWEIYRNPEGLYISSRWIVGKARLEATSEAKIRKAIGDDYLEIKKLGVKRYCEKHHGFTPMRNENMSDTDFYGEHE